MKAIFGRECSLTIFKDGTYTALPYTSETVRAVNVDYALAESVGKKERTTRLSYGQEICGCIITRLTDVCAPCLFGLIKESGVPFDILVNRVINKIVYKNVRVVGFEMRARLDGAVYVRLDIGGSNISFTESWDVHTKNILWQPIKTAILRDGTFSIQGAVVPQVYLYTLSGKFKDTNEYEIRLHSPLQHGHQLSTSQNIERLDYAVSDHATMSFFNLFPKNEGSTSDSGGEVLVNRTYRVTGIISITVQQGTNYYIASLLANLGVVFAEENYFTLKKYFNRKQQHRSVGL